MRRRARGSGRRSPATPARHGPRSPAIGLALPSRRARSPVSWSLVDGRAGERIEPNPVSAPSRLPATSPAPADVAVPFSERASACAAPASRLRRRRARCGPSRCAGAPPPFGGRAGAAVHPAPPIRHCWTLAGQAGPGARTAPGRDMRHGHRHAPVGEPMRGVLPPIFGHTPSLPTSSGCLPTRSSRVMPDCSWPIARGGAGCITAAVSPPCTLPTTACPPGWT
jgi:hypothetical protein